MLIVSDLVRMRDEHRTLNEPVFKWASGYDGPKSFVLSGDSSSLELTSNSLNSNTRPIYVRGSRFYRWVQIHYYFFQLIFAASTQKVGSKIIFTSLLPIHYFTVAVISRIFSIKFLIFMHGELGYLVKPVGLGQVIGGLFIRAAFYLFNYKRVRLAAISLPVAQNLREKFTYLKNHIVVFEHPPHDDFNSIDKFRYSTDRYKVGMFGVLSENKCCSLIYDLAARVKFPSGAKLYTVGLASDTFEFNKSKDVEHLCSGQLGVDHIPWNLFSKQCKELSWALFFYDSSKNYSLTPSGVFYDCIHWGIPILSLMNSNFKVYFDQYGDLGYLAKDLDELAELVTMILSGELSINAFESSFMRAKLDMSLEKFEARLLDFAEKF